MWKEKREKNRSFGTEKSVASAVALLGLFLLFLPALWIWRCFYKLLLLPSYNWLLRRLSISPWSAGLAVLSCAENLVYLLSLKSKITSIRPQFFTSIENFLHCFCYCRGDHLQSLRKLRGDVFVIPLEISGGFFLSQYALCMFCDGAKTFLCCDQDLLSDLPAVEKQYRTLNKCFQILEYSGLYSSCSPLRPIVDELVDRVLNCPLFLRSWEPVVSNSVRSFLQQLQLEAEFSFADRISRLVSEVVGAVFLGMKGFNVELHDLMSEYLDLCFQQNENIPARTAQCMLREDLRQKLYYAINVSINEADRVYYSPACVTKPVLFEIQEIFADLTKNEASDAIRRDALFIFLVEECFFTLLYQLRSLLSILLLGKEKQLPMCTRLNCTLAGRWSSTWIKFVILHHIKGNLSFARSSMRTQSADDERQQKGPVSRLSTRHEADVMEDFHSSDDASTEPNWSHLGDRASPFFADSRYKSHAHIEENHDHAVFDLTSRTTE